MVVKKYLTVLSGKYPANLYWIPDSAGCLNFTGYRIPVAGSGTSLHYGLATVHGNRTYDLTNPTELRGQVGSSM
jgi:hypothetical protein